VRRLATVVCGIGKAEHQQRLDAGVLQRGHVLLVGRRAGVRPRAGLDLLPVLLVPDGADPGARDQRHDVRAPALREMGHHAKGAARRGRRFQYGEGAPLRRRPLLQRDFVVPRQQRRQGKPSVSRIELNAFQHLPAPILYRQHGRSAGVITHLRLLVRPEYRWAPLDIQLRRAGRGGSRNGSSQCNGAAQPVAPARAMDHPGRPSRSGVGSARIGRLAGYDADSS